MSAPPSAPGPRILARLDDVQRERARRAQTPGLASATQAVREYQAARFRLTYADLLAAPRTRDAAGFFLTELYGVHDFIDRDAQFRRIVPGLVRLFPDEVVQTVAQLAELHALSEQLDTRMALALEPPAGPVDALRYGRAWRTVGEPASRERQIALVGQIGHALVRYTTHATLGRALRMMRLPARAAGLSALQSFLERGFTTFGALPDPHGFLDLIARRERALAAQLFAAPDGPPPDSPSGCPPGGGSDLPPGAADASS